MDQIACLSQAVNDLKDTIYCPICFDILSDPVSTKCNHHFCSQCFKTLFKSRGTHHCPVCHTSLTRRSCAKNIGSLNQIVQAVKELIESLITDTGIDFSKEKAVPQSSREAACDDEIIGQQVSQNGSDQNIASKQCEKEKLHKNGVTTKNKNIKQYHRKTQPINVEDSFLFPADFIHPTKGSGIKQKQSESANSKVSSWLTENEEDLNENDEMSILNGSLPKRVPVDLNISSSEEELLSVSQVDNSSKTHLAPLKFKTDLQVITEQSEDKTRTKTNSPEFKDPYEFISSQKSNQAQISKKPQKKRNSRNYGNKKKPLGLDISRLVNEPYAKKKKLEMNNTAFDVPVLLDDTFDQLLSGNKKSQFVATSNKEDTSKVSEDKKATVKNDVLIFQSQNDPVEESVILSDFSSGSDDDWAPTKPKRLHKIKQCTSGKGFKLRLSKVKTPRKSIGNMAKKNKEENERKEREIVENINKTLEEVERHKLVTSSQVMREEIARKQEIVADSEKSITKDVCNTKVLRKDDIGLQEIEIASHMEENNITKDETDYSHSPGWSRVNHFKKESNCGMNLSGKSHKKNKHSPNSNTCIKKSKVVIQDKIETGRSLESEYTSKTKQTQLSKENMIHQIEDNLKGKEDIREVHHIHSPACSVRKINLSSPEEPVKYLNLSQSEERARIMDNVVKSLESSLKEEEKAQQIAASSDSRISVSMPSLPDEDEHIVENCIKELSARRELNAERLDAFSGVLDTPASVVMSCDTETLVTQIDNNTDKQLQILAQDNNNFNATDTTRRKRNNLNILYSKRNITGKATEEHTSFKREGDKLQKLTMEKDSVKLCTSESNNEKLSVEDLNCSDKVLSSSKISNQIFTEESSDLQTTSTKIEQSKPTNITVVSNKQDPLEYPRKGILVVKNAEESAVQISSKENMHNEAKGESPGHVGRRVHFAEMPIEEERQILQYSSTGRSVIFLKAGNCSSSYCRPRVRFLFLGSCLNKAEKSHVFDRWIIKVSKTYPSCFCGNNSANCYAIGSLSNSCDQRASTSLEHDGNEDTRTTANSEEISIENAENFSNGEKHSIEEAERPRTVNGKTQNSKATDIVHKLHVGSSVYQDIQLHSENSTCVAQKLKESVINEDEIQKDMECDFAEDIQKLSNSVNLNNHISSETLKKSDFTEDIVELPRVMKPNSHKSSELKLFGEKQMSGEIKSGNCVSSHQQSQKTASGDDIFKSYQNSGDFGSPFQNDEAKVCSDGFESEEHNGVLPYQEPHEKASDDVRYNQNVCELSLQKHMEKPNVNILMTDQKGDGYEKPSTLEKVSNNNNALQSSNGICSTDEDIFQSNEINSCFVPLSQEIHTSEISTETLHEKNVKFQFTSNDDNLNCNRKKQIKSSEYSDVCESDKVYSSSDNSELLTTMNNLSTSRSNICVNSEDVFKTDGNSSISQSPCQRQIDTVMVGKSCSSNSNNSSEFISQSDQNTSPIDRISPVDETPEHPSKHRKRARPLTESSDDSDNERKVVKKVNKVPSLSNTITTGLSHAPPLNYHSKKEHSNVKTQNFQNTEDDDCLLNSEELLQRVIDNINEDLGTTKAHTPKLRGAKKKISSDSEDDFVDYDMEHRKLSKSPEYDQQENVDLNEDEDVFKDNDVDIIEGTPTKSRTEDLNKRRNSSEKMNLSGNTPDDVFEKESQVSVSKKFVLPPSSYSESRNETVERNASYKTLKKPDQSVQPMEKDTNKNVSVSKMKESAESFNLFDSPQKCNLENSSKIPLQVHLGSSQRNEKNIQKSVVESVQKELPAPSNDTVKSQRRMVFVCSGLTGRLVAVVRKFANEIGAGFSDNFTMLMTHLIVNVDENRATPKTLKYLQTVAAKKWVVSFNWITACKTAKRILPEEQFEAIDTLGLDGPRRSRLSSESLFKNVQACFIEPFQNITVDKLQEIFMMCGGMVVDSPEGFSVVSSEVLRIIIVDNDAEIDAALCQKWMYRNRGVTLNYEWLVDCIGTHTILPLPSSFAVPFTREQVLACGIPEHLLDEDDMEITGASEISDISCLPES